MTNYTIGVDFGTLSARAVLVDVRTGEVAASAQHAYAHGVMDETLPSGRTLPHEWALQDAGDYLEALEKTVSALVDATGIAPQQVIGIGTDFTACTLVPACADGTPLHMLAAFKDEPHAYVKLWKHHAAQQDADRINELAHARGETWHARYGGRVSSEWMFPKIMQILREAPQVYRQTDVFLEAGDWIVWQMTGKCVRSACAAGYKGMWDAKRGYPDTSFFAALDARLGNVVCEKLGGVIQNAGTRAGGLTVPMARRLGLVPGTAVATGGIDAHVTVPAAGVTQPGEMTAIMGTSTCLMLMQERFYPVRGICGAVRDGILPGLYGYEAGQSCVGDHFAWLTDHFADQDDVRRARDAGQDMHAYWSARAARLRPGQSGLLALDWWNGNRSVLADTGLSGLLIGMTLRTRAYEIYRALIEATAFGARRICDEFAKSDVPVHRFVASGGIAVKNPFLMQVYADILNMPVSVIESSEAPALGAAIFAAVAAGEDAGGWDTVQKAASAMHSPIAAQYKPDAQNVQAYARLYGHYCALHDLFGCGGSDVMHDLRRMRNETLAAQCGCQWDESAL